MGRWARAILIVAALTWGGILRVRSPEGQVGSPGPGPEAGLPAAPPREAIDLKSTPLGRRVSDFTLRDFRGKEHTLSELADRKAVVVVFLGCDCPLASLYGPCLARLARDLVPRGVAFLAINANAQDSLADLASYARRHQLPFPLLKDPDHAVADQMGAVRTPEAFLLDGDRVVRYWGRIDDQYAIGVQRARATRNDLADALGDLLAGRPVARPVALAPGCHIGRVPRGEPRGEITYSRHVRRILHKHCLECHRPGEAAPFPLTDHADVAGWSAMIREVVEQGRMPPWSADAPLGHFRNDPRLSPEDKRLLLTWIDNGCPPGDLADLPELPGRAPGWRIPGPDQVVYMSEEPFTVPAEGDLGYLYYEVNPGFTEDKYLQAVEVRPGNRTVVHHALVSILPPGGEPGLELDSSGALLDYAPGMPPTILPEGLAIRVPAGSRFLFQMHYTPCGSVQQDRSYLGLVFADPARVRHEVRGGAVLSQGIEIPAGARDHVEAGELVLSEPVQLLSLSPHLHLRGKAFRYEAVHPDGRREVLLDVPSYDFSWQLRYDLGTPRTLPRGTRLVCTARYDNSADNPANPDPTQTVVWGDQTSDEMLIGFFAYMSLPR